MDVEILDIIKPERHAMRQLHAGTEAAQAIPRPVVDKFKLMPGLLMVLLLIELRSKRGAA